MLCRHTQAAELAAARALHRRAGMPGGQRQPTRLSSLSPPARQVVLRACPGRGVAPRRDGQRLWCTCRLWFGGPGAPGAPGLSSAAAPPPSHPAAATPLPLPTNPPAGVGLTDWSTASLWGKVRGAGQGCCVPCGCCCRGAALSQPVFRLLLSCVCFASTLPTHARPPSSTRHRSSCLSLARSRASRATALSLAFPCAASCSVPQATRLK